MREPAPSSTKSRVLRRISQPSIVPPARSRRSFSPIAVHPDRSLWRVASRAALQRRARPLLRELVAGGSGVDEERVRVVDVREGAERPRGRRDGDLL